MFYTEDLANILSLINDKDLDLIELLKIQRIVKRKLNNINVVTKIQSIEEFSKIPLKFHNKCDIDYDVKQSDLIKYINVHTISFCDEKVSKIHMLKNLHTLNCSETD